MGKTFNVRVAAFRGGSRAKDSRGKIIETGNWGIIPKRNKLRGGTSEKRRRIPRNPGRERYETPRAIEFRRKGRRNGRNEQPSDIGMEKK